MATISKYQTAGGTTLYRVRYRTPDGRQTDKRGFKRKLDAERFANTVEVEKLTGTYVAPKLGHARVGDLGPVWLERQRGHLKLSSFHSLESAWHVHVAPRWSRLRINDIRFSDVQAWISELAAVRGSTVIRTAHSVLARMLDDAVRDRMLASNPARGVKLPPRTPRKNVYMTAAQLNRLADEAGHYRALVLMLGVGGVRWGEAAALRVSDVDFLRRRVTLHANAVKVGGTFAVGSLKSNKNRMVVLPAFVVDALADTSQGKGRDDLLWPSASGGYLGPPSSHDSWLSGAVARCQKADPASRE